MKKKFTAAVLALLAVFVCVFCFASDASDSYAGTEPAGAGREKTAAKLSSSPEDNTDLDVLKERFGFKDIDNVTLEDLISKAETIMDAAGDDQSSELAGLNKYAGAILDEEAYNEFLDKLYPDFQSYIKKKYKDIDDDYLLLAFMDLFDDDILADYEVVNEILQADDSGDKNASEYIELLFDLLITDYYDNPYYKDVYQLLKCINAYDEKRGLEGRLYEMAIEKLEAWENDIFENTANDVFEDTSHNISDSSDLVVDNK